MQVDKAAEERKGRAIKMRLEGMNYREIGAVLGITRQRVQQLIRPHTAIRQYVGRLANWNCQNCGIHTPSTGDLHHKASTNLAEEDYNDLPNLIYLCKACHRKAHCI